ncbi:hypothetical protein [Chitinimonas sp.]|uniref:hypothetical protein n=1 Tax=Chitinimonas sp. TaxID=1934313 RepID=UPI0035AF93BE
MGLDISFVFQKKIDHKWIDIESNYQGDRDYDLYNWLGLGRARCAIHFEIDPISEPRGLPYDFEIDREGLHPTTLSVKRSHWGEHVIHIGETSRSWLLGSEILATKVPPVKITERMDSSYCLEDKNDGFPLWQFAIPNLNHDPGPPDVLTEVGNEMIFEWMYDLYEDFKYFVDEVRRLVDLHGVVRIVYGFS